MILIGTILVLYYLWFIQNVLLPILSPPEVITTLETSLLQAPNCTTCVFHWESVKHINTNCVQALKKLWKIGVICEMHLPNSCVKIYFFYKLTKYPNWQFYNILKYFLKWKYRKEILITGQLKFIKDVAAANFIFLLNFAIHLHVLRKPIIDRMHKIKCSL